MIRTMNIFSFNDKHYLQTHGTDYGDKDGSFIRQPFSRRIRDGHLITCPFPNPHTVALHTTSFSLRASSPIWASETSLARTRERASGEVRGARVLARLASLAQIGELARRLDIFMIWTRSVQDLNTFTSFLNEIHPTIKFTRDYSFTSRYQTSYSFQSSSLRRICSTGV